MKLLRAHEDEQRSGKINMQKTWNDSSSQGKWKIFHFHLIWPIAPLLDCRGVSVEICRTLWTWSSVYQHFLKEQRLSREKDRPSPPVSYGLAIVSLCLQLNNTMWHRLGCVVCVTGCLPYERSHSTNCLGEKWVVITEWMTSPSYTECEKRTESWIQWLLFFLSYFGKGIPTIPHFM